LKWQQKYPKVTESDHILHVAQEIFAFLTHEGMDKFTHEGMDKWVSRHEIQEYFKDKPISKRYLEEALHSLGVSKLIYDKTINEAQHFNIGPQTK